MGGLGQYIKVINQWFIQDVPSPLAKVVTKRHAHSITGSIVTIAYTAIKTLFWGSINQKIKRIPNRQIYRIHSFITVVRCLISYRTNEQNSLAVA